MQFHRYLLLAPALLIFAFFSCERTKLYPIKAAAYASPNPALATGENDSPLPVDPPGGSRAPGVTDGAPSTTAQQPPAAPGQSNKPGEGAGGGQAAGSTSGGSSTGPAAGGEGPPPVPPK